MTTSGTVFYGFMCLLGYLVAPASLAWGWTRWIKNRPRSWAISSTLSFVGFLLASASALIALSMIVFALAGGFEQNPDVHGHPPDIFQWIQAGKILSLSALLLALTGVFRRSSTRWLAPASAAGMFAFWLLATPVI